MGVPARRGAAALRKAWADAVDNRMAPDEPLFRARHSPGHRSGH